MLKIENVTKKYGEKVAVDNLSLEVKDGEIFGFVGPNGAGKTTLIKAIVGIHGIDSGDIILNDNSIVSNPLLVKQEIAYIPDNPDIYPNLKGIDYLNFIADVYLISKNDRIILIDKYAKVFDIYQNLGDLIATYSHGMKQKLVIISALIHNPRLLILDEPFVGLDPKSSKILKDIMQEMTKNGTSIFFSSHILEVVEKLCDRVGIIKNGSLIAYDKTENITKNKDLEDVFLELTNE